MSATTERNTIWRPQPGFQTAFVRSPVFEVFGGGARGGGKTEAVLGDWAAHASKYGDNAIGLMVRRTRIELMEMFERARQIYSRLGATLTMHPMRCVMRNGARLTFAYLERDADAEQFQGHSYTRVYVEEAGNFPSPAPILKLMATLRSGAGVPVGLRLTGNPGGPGHHWLKARYIDPAPLGWQVIRDEETGLERIYLPSRVHDNAYLGEDYVARLKASGTPELVRAWLEGDWNVVSGAFFPEFTTEKHVIEPQELPRYWYRFRSFDWGSARPFACHWWAVSDGELPRFLRGALICYREWYGAQTDTVGRIVPNTGLRLTAEEVADGIRQREQDDLTGTRQMGGVADPSIFAQDGGPSIADRMAGRKVLFREADNTRVARLGALGGWDQLRARLKGDGEKPALVLFSTCTELIRTLPTMQHDPDRPEDLETDSEDHAVDSCRYSCMSRPYTAPLPPEMVPEHDRYRDAVKRRAHRGLGRSGSWAA